MELFPFKYLNMYQFETCALYKINFKAMWCDGTSQKKVARVEKKNIQGFVPLISVLLSSLLSFFHFLSHIPYLFHLWDGTFLFVRSSSPKAPLPIDCMTNYGHDRPRSRFQFCSLHSNLFS